MNFPECKCVIQYYKKINVLFYFADIKNYLLKLWHTASAAILGGERDMGAWRGCDIQSPLSTLNVHLQIRWEQSNEREKNPREQNKLKMYQELLTLATWVRKDPCPLSTLTFYVILALYTHFFSWLLQACWNIRSYVGWEEGFLHHVPQHLQQPPENQMLLKHSTWQSLPTSRRILSKKDKVASNTLLNWLTINKRLQFWRSSNSNKIMKEKNLESSVPVIWENIQGGITIIFQEWYDYPCIFFQTAFLSTDNRF